MRAHTALIVGLAALGLTLAACGDKPPPPGPGLDKSGIRNRSDQNFDSVKEEEQRNKQRKDQQQ